MGNSCGEMCNNAHDQKEVVVIEIVPRQDAVQWIKQDQPTSVPLQSIVDRQSQRIIQHYNSEKMESLGNKPKGLIHWDEDRTSDDEQSEVPQVEAKFEQNHLIVPRNLVSSRVSDKIQLLLKKEFPTSPLTQEDARWFLLQSGNYYSGQLQQGQPKGIGTYMLPSKVFYGETSGDKPQGNGIIVSDEFVFKGQFSEGKATGEATLQSRNYNAKGMFTDGEIQDGKIITKEYVYEGHFSKGRPHGKGFYNNILEKIYYQGGFANGKFHGSGKYTCPDYEYKGQYQNGMKEGEGMMESLVGQKKVRRGMWSRDRLVKVL